MDRTEMMARLALLAIFGAIATLMSGCAPVMVAGAGTAVVAGHDRRTVGAMVDDEAVEFKGRVVTISDERFKPDVHVNITSMNGIVLVTGEAANTEVRDLVLQKIRAIAGVRQVVNEIRIAAPASLVSRTQDSWLTTKVKTSMINIDGLDASRVKVVTENDSVYLLGLVTRKEAELATERARTVSGVARVVKLFEYVD